jgi:hypothetical protein
MTQQLNSAMRSRVAWTAAAVGLALAPATRAAELGASATSVDVHGFVSQGFIKSTGSDYLAESKRGSFAFSEVGINFTSQLTDRVRAGMQLFAYKLGALGNYDAKADWYYLDYRPRDWLGVRAGRVKLPFGLYNDISDIDSARVPVLLPGSIYPATNRNVLLAQTGGEVYGYVDLNRAGALDYRLWGGTIFVDLPSQPGAAAQIAKFAVPWASGGRVVWEPPVEGLRIAGSWLILKYEATVLYPMPLPQLDVTAMVYGGIGSVEYIFRDLLLAAEYAQTRTDRTHSSDPMMFPELAIVSEGAYALAAYRVRRWLTPGAYYSFYYPNRNVRDGRQNMQHDATATLRFDVNEHWIIKLEAHFMHGTARAAGSAMMHATAPENWGVFLIKTTAYF